MNNKLILSIVLILLSNACFSQIRIGFINDSLESPNELSVAVNPLNPNNWVVGANINQLYITFDSGKTWLEKEQISSLGPYGDPVILADSQGIFYHAHLSKTPNKPRPDYLDRMIVQRSLDGGLTWNDGVGVGYNQGKVQDKEWLSIDQVNGSQFKGTLYMSWTEFDVYGSPNPKHQSRIRFSSSHNQGKSFSKPIVVSDSTGDCIDGDNTLEGATTAIGPNGEIYIVWAGHGSIWFDKSLDGGKHFGKDKIIGSQKMGWTYKVPGVYRSNAMPFIKCNTRTGEIFIVYADSSEGKFRLVLLSSKDQGITWNEKKLHPKGGNHIFFPNLEIDEETNEIALLYYQNNQTQDSLSAYLIIYTNEGKVHIDQLGPRFPVPSNKVFFGDYIDLCQVKNGYLCVWTSFEEEKLRARYAVWKRD